MPAKLKGNVVVDMLNKKGWSQNKLALKLKTSSGYLSQAINGTRNLSHKMRDAILRLLNCKYDDLFITIPRKKRLVA